MIHLKIFEEFFDKDQFKSFMDKYKKTGYISKGSIKSFDKSDLKYKYFKNIQDSVSECVSFANKCNIPLLKDLLQEICDDYSPYVDRDDIKIYFNIYAKDRSIWSTDPVILIISEDEKGIPSREHIKTSDTLILIENLVNRLIESRKQSIEKTKSEIEDSKKRTRPGMTPYGTDTLNKLNSTNILKDVEISPQMVISMFFRFEDDEDYSFSPEYRKFKSDTVYSFEKELKGVMDRYFYAIGYQNEFIINNSYSYYGHWCEFKVTPKLKFGRY